MKKRHLTILGIVAAVVVAWIVMRRNPQKPVVGAGGVDLQSATIENVLTGPLPFPSSQGTSPVPPGITLPGIASTVPVPAPVMRRQAGLAVPVVAQGNPSTPLPSAAKPAPMFTAVSTPMARASVPVPAPKTATGSLLQRGATQALSKVGYTVSSSIQAAPAPKPKATFTSSLLRGGAVKALGKAGYTVSGG
jgi:hypothetical protein